MCASIRTETEAHHTVELYLTGHYRKPSTTEWLHRQASNGAAPRSNQMCLAHACLTHRIMGPLVILVRFVTPSSSPFWRTHQSPQQTPLSPPQWFRDGLQDTSTLKGGEAGLREQPLAPKPWHIYHILTSTKAETDLRPL